MPETAALACPVCGTEVATGLLSCPGCRRLIHAERLKFLAEQAGRAELDGALSESLASWREVLELLPRGSKQAQTVEAKISDLGLRVDTSPNHAPSRDPRNPPTDAAVPTGKPWMSLAGIGSLLLILAGKAKFLVLGLTKGSTLLTMFASLGVYWAAFGWKFALGLVLSIYIHEMGHVAVLIRYGIKASAPLFLPGLGAVIRLKQTLSDPRQDARVGLAGPVWGLGAALASYAVFLIGGFPVWGAIAKLGAFINLFNLIPFWQLDGGRAFRVFSRPQRWLAAMVIAVAWALTNEGLLLLLLAVASYRAFADRPADRPDAISVAVYLGLIATLSAMARIPVPIGL